MSPVRHGERHFGVLRMVTWDTGGQQCSLVRANDL
jgi:hypothetical protein